MAAIQYAAEHDYDYVYKVDTDVFVLPEIFLKFVKTQVVDKNIDWMGSENKMYPAYLDPSIDFTDPANAADRQSELEPVGVQVRARQGVALREVHGCRAEQTTVRRREPRFGGRRARIHLE